MDEPEGDPGRGMNVLVMPQGVTAGDNKVDDDRPKPSERPTPNERPGETTGRPSPRRRHGYAAVEIHQGAARVIRWEVEEEREPSAEQSERQRRLFRLGEWLAKQPISDQARAEYFDIERVSYVKAESS
jgi:hypothetical protein